MTKRPTFKEFKIKALQDKNVQAEFDRLDAEFELLEQSIKLRKIESAPKKHR